MADGRFVESECEVGGCACPCWDAWYQGRRAFAQAHPRAKALDAIKDDTEYSEAVDALAEDLDGAYAHAAGPCARPTCRRHAAA